MSLTRGTVQGIPSVRGRRAGMGVMVSAMAGSKAAGRAGGEDRENYAELLMSSAPVFALLRALSALRNLPSAPPRRLSPCESLQIHSHPRPPPSHPLRFLRLLALPRPEVEKNGSLGWLIGWLVLWGVAFCRVLFCWDGFYFWNMSIAWLVMPVKSFRSQVA